MKKQHQLAIQMIFPTLVKKCNLDPILPLLLLKGVFPPQDIGVYTSGPYRRRKINLFTHIQLCGTQAFNILVTTLRKTGQFTLADLLVTQEIRIYNRPFLLPHDRSPHSNKFQKSRSPKKRDTVGTNGKSRPPQYWTHNGKPICFSCLKPGHKQLVCWNKLNNNRRAH